MTRRIMLILSQEICKIADSIVTAAFDPLAEATIVKAGTVIDARDIPHIDEARKTEVLEVFTEGYFGQCRAGGRVAAS